ncbi:MAG: hypothetical protein ACXADU_09235 [Promethearchaeota archaeon]|jgi:hypothetical protein
MVEAVIYEEKLEEKVPLPTLNVLGKENAHLYFKLLVAGTPKLKFSIVDKTGKERYSNLLNVEMR